MTRSSAFAARIGAFATGLRNMAWQTADGHLKLLGAEGESLAGPILKIGNTNSRLRFPLPPAEFVTRWSMEGSTHHCALGTGHRLGTIEKLSKFLPLPLTRVG